MHIGSGSRWPVKPSDFDDPAITVTAIFRAAVWLVMSHPRMRTANEVKHFDTCLLDSVMPFFAQKFDNLSSGECSWAFDCMRGRIRDAGYDDFVLLNSRETYVNLMTFSSTKVRLR